MSHDMEYEKSLLWSWRSSEVTFSVLVRSNELEFDLTKTENDKFMSNGEKKQKSRQTDSGLPPPHN